MASWSFWHGLDYLRATCANEAYFSKLETMFLIVDWLGSGCFEYSARNAFKRLSMSAYHKKILIKNTRSLIVYFIFIRKCKYIVLYIEKILFFCSLICNTYIKRYRLKTEILTGEKRLIRNINRLEWKSLIVLIHTISNPPP